MTRHDRNQRRPEDGFTLIELLLVVSVIGILATIAIPALTQARAAAYEVSTIGSLRALNGAQATYASSCGGGFYAPSITWLGQPPGAGKAAFIGPEFTADITDRFSYRIRFTAGSVALQSPRACNGPATGQLVQSYFIAADTLAINSSRHFGTSAGGTIYQSTTRVPAFYTGSPPAPAKPIQ